MPAPSTIDEFLELVRRSDALDRKRLDSFIEKVRSSPNLPSDPSKLAGLMVREGLLTLFQAEQFLLGRTGNFAIGKYKVLERLGSGGVSNVYLCEHHVMRNRVAIKILVTEKAEDPAILQRFYREARAAASLDHPNIARAYDIDRDNKLHYLVMEYVDGSQLQKIVIKHGPMDVLRACHYMRQAALGLQHAHEAGMVHRDIKPSNILVDRTGLIKILDMGLARITQDENNVLLTQKESVLGTADFLSPEQALDSHGVDIRADIYSLGATFYFILTGRNPFNEGTLAQKLIWLQTKPPVPISTLRPEVPKGVVAIIEKMMAKHPDQRYQTPAEVAEALTPWTMRPIPPPPGKEMPVLSSAAQAHVYPPSSPQAPPPAPPGVDKMALTPVRPLAKPAAPATSAGFLLPDVDTPAPPALRPKTMADTDPRGLEAMLADDTGIPPAAVPKKQRKRLPLLLVAVLALLAGVGIAAGLYFFGSQLGIPLP